MKPTMRSAMWILLLAIILGTGSWLTPSVAEAGDPVAYMTSPESLGDRSVWEIAVVGQGDQVTLKIKGTHPKIKEDCSQEPKLKAIYNAKKARIKTRQMDRVKCRTTEQTATLKPQDRRAIEVFVNGDLIGFVDVEGATSAPGSGVVSQPLVLPNNPAPGEPVFIVVPLKPAEKSCWTLGKMKQAKKGTDLSVEVPLKKGDGCSEEKDAYQVLASFGPLGKGTYSFTGTEGKLDFGVGEQAAAAPRKASDEEKKPAADEEKKPAADEEKKPADEEEKPAADEAKKPAADEAKKPAADEAKKPAKPCKGKKCPKEEEIKPTIAVPIDVY